MLLEKIFHVHQPIDETRTRLAAFASYRRQLDRVSKACLSANGVARFCFEPGLGYALSVELVQMPDTTAHRILFRSIGGNIRVAGAIEFFAVRENVTEVVLTIDYQLQALLARTVDSLTRVIERFIDAQLRRMQAHFEGVGNFPTHYSDRCSHSQSNSSAANDFANAER